MKAINEIHLKYVGDLTLAEAISLPDKLVHVPESVRPMPDMLHARTGHIMPNQEETSRVLQELLKTKQYADDNDMRINFKKTKALIFNPCTWVS
jgi:hypothetical protein